MVWELQLRGVVVWRSCGGKVLVLESCGVGELLCGVITECGSNGLGQLQFWGTAVW